MESAKYITPNVRAAVKRAYKLAGGKGRLALALGISYQSIDGWAAANTMPSTEYKGTTLWSMEIEFFTGGEVTITDLLGFVPPPQQWAMDVDIRFN